LQCLKRLLYRVVLIATILGFGFCHIPTAKHVDISIGYHTQNKELTVQMLRFPNLFELVCILYTVFSSFDLVLYVRVLAESERTHKVL